MFVQVIKGRTSDADGFRRQVARWRDELRPGAVGFIGSTAGAADDGTFLVIARFEDEAAARANADRPEQTAWWNEMAKCLDGEPSFRDSNDVSVLFEAGCDAAGFVQVMEGTADRAAVDAAETPELVEQLRAARPDLLGSIRTWFGGGSFVEVAYFSSEEAARAGEASADFAGPQAEFAELFGEVTFTDLRDPILT